MAAVVAARPTAIPLIEPLTAICPRDLAALVAWVAILLTPIETLLKDILAAFPSTFPSSAPAPIPSFRWGGSCLIPVSSFSLEIFLACPSRSLNPVLGALRPSSSPFTPSVSFSFPTSSIPSLNPATCPSATPAAFPASTNGLDSASPGGAWIPLARFSTSSPAALASFATSFRPSPAASIIPSFAFTSLMPSVRSANGFLSTSKPMLTTSSLIMAISCHLPFAALSAAFFLAPRRRSYAALASFISDGDMSQNTAW